MLVLYEPTNDLDLETLELLEAGRDALRLRTTGPEFYKETADAIRVALARLEAIDPELTKAYDRWNALDARA